MEVESTSEESKSNNNSKNSNNKIDKSRKLKIWKAKWQKMEYPIYFDSSTTIGDIKAQLEAQTEVRSSKQKLLGFKILNKHKSLYINGITDNTLISHLKCGKKKSFMLVGTKDSDIFDDSDLLGLDIPFVLDDEDWLYNEDSEELLKRHNEHIKKLEKSIKNTKINIIQSPRKHKKLLVLDIDYTLFDMGSKNVSDWNKLKRPYTDYLLEKCYLYYDLVIWSQTSWQWIEIKLTEMNMLSYNNSNNKKYKFSFILDKKSMFTVVTNYFPSNKTKSKNKSGLSRKHYVKPLELIWRKFPEYYNKYNTIHIDDLGRNFALNPLNGLKCIPFKKQLRLSNNDNELLHITNYLIKIAKLDNFKGINHSKWKEYLKKHKD